MSDSSSDLTFEKDLESDTSEKDPVIEISRNPYLDEIDTEASLRAVSWGVRYRED